MVKLIFFDLDDCLVESSTPLQKMVNENTPFKNSELAFLEYQKSMSKYALDYNARMIKEAEQKGIKPQLIGSIKAGSNDIFKTSSNIQIDELERKKDRLKRWYHAPLLLSKEVYERISWDLEMFKEHRDHYLEEDNQKSFVDGVIAYQDIFVRERMIPYAYQMVNDVEASKEYQGVYVLSHHNGGREQFIKKSFIRDVFPKVPFIGLRFHSEKFQENIRRPRSSKALYIMKKFGLNNLEGCILVDDSLENLDEWARYGGISILYRPLNQDEIFLGKMDDHGREYPRITAMKKELLDEALKKTKTYVYK